MIYLDTSVTLAALFAESTRPPDRLWRDALVSSRLLEYEVGVRINARGAAPAALKAARALLDGVSLLEMTPDVLGRALLPFASPVRTLDALHLASLDFLRTQGLSVPLATYDQRLATAAAGMGFALAEC